MCYVRLPHRVLDDHQSDQVFHRKAMTWIGSPWLHIYQVLTFHPVRNHPVFFTIFAVVIILVGFKKVRRVIEKLESYPPQERQTFTRTVSLPSPFTTSPLHYPYEGIARAFDNESLHDRRLQQRYRKVKAAWLRQFQMLSNKVKKAKGKDRSDRQMEDGLGSIYSPIEPPKPTNYSRQLSSELSFEGVKLHGDGYTAFMAIMDQWKVFGGPDVPLLSRLCHGVEQMDVMSGDVLFHEGEPLHKCLYVLVEGELEISVHAVAGGPSETLELISAESTIVSGILEFVALLTDSKVAEHYLTATCRTDCHILRIPIDLMGEALRTTGANARCRLVRSCLIRSYRVTLLTAYAHLGVIYDLHPRHPTFPITSSTLQNLSGLEVDVYRAYKFFLPGYGQSSLFTEKTQRALKHLIRQTLALEKDYEIPDISETPSITSPRSPTPYRSDSFRVPTSPLGDHYTNGFGHVPPSSNRSSGIKLYLLRQGESPHELDEESKVSMHILVSGRLVVKAERAREPKVGKSIFTDCNMYQKHGPAHVNSEHGPGAVIGYSLLLMGTPEEWYIQRGKRPALLRLTASEDSWVMQLSPSFLEQASSHNPLATIGLAARKVLETVPRVLRLIDFGIKWKQLNAGEVLVTEGQPSDGCLYVLLYGRARSALTEQGQMTVVGEHGRGTLIGETEILTGGVHKTTVQAVRYTSFATIPCSVLSLLVRRHPRILSHLSEHVVRKAQHRASREVRTSEAWQRAVIGAQNARTMLVLPVSAEAPLLLFCRTLEAAMRKAGHSVKVVSRKLAMAALGCAEEDEIDMLLLETWLTQQEEQYEIVVYQADWQATEWSRLAAAMADAVLLVGNANDEPTVSYLEQQLEPMTRNAQKLLIMLHVNPSRDYMPRRTREWIEKRHGVNRCYHVRVHEDQPSFDQNHIRSDFARLGRILTGSAVGVVLGGGGARGMAHLGLLRVLEEENIPVDYVVGVSIGAFVGGLYAKHSSYLQILPHVSRFSASMNNTWLFVRDFTLPTTSYFNGYSFGRVLETAFGETKIEDCWLSYACLTVDLSTSRERIHQNGTMWRYVRGSMTLAGLLPPLCDVDPKTDAVHYLVDGGYINNLPGDVMRDLFGAETIIACDIGSEVVMTGQDSYGDTFTGLNVLFNFLPWSKALKAPSMGEISSQLMYVRSVESLERVKELVDCYLQPPVTKVGIMEWKRHAEVQALGYHYARETIRTWRQSQRRQAKRRPQLSQTGQPVELELKRGLSLSALDSFGRSRELLEKQT